MLETQTFNVLHACIKALFLESISNNLIDWVKLCKYREKVWNLLRHILRIHTSFKGLFLKKCINYPHVLSGQLHTEYINVYINNMQWIHTSHSEIVYFKSKSFTEKGANFKCKNSVKNMRFYIEFFKSAYSIWSWCIF